MPRISRTAAHTPAKSNRYAYHGEDSEEEEEEEGAREQGQAIRSLGEVILAPVQQLVSKPGIPKSEEERHQFFGYLIRLKEERKTNRECAEILGVSERTISTYVSEPYYRELQQEQLAEARQRGHLRIAEVIDDAVDTLYMLMKGAKSEFVSYKAAEKLLDVAGYNVPQEEQRADAREGLAKFMSEVQSRQTVVNVQITNTPTRANEENGNPSMNVVDSTVSESSGILPPVSSRYSQPVLAGGKMPVFSSPLDRHQQQYTPTSGEEEATHADMQIGKEDDGEEGGV